MRASTDDLASAIWPRDHQRPCAAVIGREKLDDGADVRQPYGALVLVPLSRKVIDDIGTRKPLCVLRGYGPGYKKCRYEGGGNPKGRDIFTST